MKNVFTRDIPPRAAAVVLALVLLATVVTGREEKSAPGLPMIEPQKAQPISMVEQTDLRLPVRSLQERSMNDLFAAPVEPAAAPQPAAAAIAAVQPVQVPSAPPLPFRYLGRMKRTDRQLVYLLRGEEMVIAEAGQTLGGTYRVESISASSLQLVYLPLGVHQNLSLPEVP